MSEHILSSQNVAETQRIPSIALALRVTVEIFRVLSQDGEQMTAKSLLDYFNRTELAPFTIGQLFDLFEIHNIDNLLSEEVEKLPKSKNKAIN